MAVHPEYLTETKKRRLALQVTLAIKRSVGNGISHRQARLARLQAISVSQRGNRPPTIPINLNQGLIVKAVNSENFAGGVAAIPKNHGDGRARAQFVGVCMRKEVSILADCDRRA
jgi:hypothetical protein